VLLNASGCLDALTAPDVARALDAFVTKTVTPLPRDGNAPQRIAETDVGMLNSIGLANPGIDRFVTRNLPPLEKLGIPLWISVGGFETDDYAEICSRLDDEAEVAAIELNVSCPNVHSGLIVGEQPAETAALLEELRPLTAKPLIVKLTPNVANPADVAVGAEEGGADAVSLINTLKASAVDPATGEPGVAAGHGGLSGPAVRPVAVAQVRAVAAAVSIPIVGMGGVSGGADALEMLAAGATLAAVGTESFRDPGAGKRVASELAELLESGQDRTVIGRGA
jgi:dihydroorotate dehydrogenase (NAD+) catalytic subunit